MRFLLDFGCEIPLLVENNKYVVVQDTGIIKTYYEIIRDDYYNNDGYIWCMWNEVHIWLNDLASEDYWPLR